MSKTNRSFPEKPAIAADDAKLIRHALASVYSGLKGEKPEFAHDLTRAEAESRNVALDVWFVRCRQALALAEAQGPGVLAVTLHRIEVATATIFARIVQGYEPLPSAADFSGAVLRLAEETADVVMAAHRVQYDPTPGNIARLQTETLEALDIGSDVADMTAARLVERVA